MDNLNLFNNKAENYVKSRPNYAKQVGIIHRPNRKMIRCLSLIIFYLYQIFNFKFFE